MPPSTTRSLFLQIGGSASELTIATKAGKSALLELGQSAEGVQATVRRSFETLGGTFADQAKAMEQSYARSLANIQATARTALKAPTQAGAMTVLNLSAAKAEADQAASAASFLRTLADAQSRLVDTGAEASAGARALAVALELDAIGAEKTALAARETVGSLERLAVASGLAVTDLDEVSGAHGRMGASGLIADHVIRSFADSVTAGQSPVRALALELPRITEAMQFMALSTGASEGAMGKFASFMGGGWGIAITAAISIASVLGGTLLGGADAADQDAKAHDALKDAVDRLAGSEAALNHETAQGIINDINAANALRQKEIATRGLLQAQLQQAKALAASTASAPTSGTGLDESAQATRGLTHVLPTIIGPDYDKQLADNQKSIDDANKAMLAGATKLIQRGIEGATDPRSKINQRFQDRADSLDRQFQSGKLKPSEYRAQYTQATTKRDSDLEAFQQSQRNPRRPRADHSVQKALGADISFTTEEEKLRKAYLDAAEKTTANQDARDALAKQEIEAERSSTAKEITDRYGKGDYGKTGSDLAKAHRDELLALNDAAAQQKARNVDTERLSANTQASFAIQKDALDAAIKFTEAQQDLATTTAARRDLALKLLALEQQRDALGPAQVLADPKSTPDQHAQALQDKTAQADLAPLQRRNVEQQNASPIQAYKDQLQRSAGDTNTALQGVAVDGLKSLDDGLTGLVSGTESVSQAFKKMATSIISDLARIAIEKEIVSVLGGSFFGIPIGGKADGGLAAYATGGLPGFATGASPSVLGGIIRGPGTGRSDSILALVGGKKPIRISNGEGIVNERAVKSWWPVIDQMNKGTFGGFADGGLPAIPTSMPTLSPSDTKELSLRPAAPTRPIMFDLRGAVMTADLLKQMQTMAHQAGVGGAMAGQRLAAEDRHDDAYSAIPQ